MFSNQPRILALIGLASLAWGCLAPRASAAIQDGDLVRMTRDSGTYGGKLYGGEFRVTEQNVVSPDMVEVFKTFCLEYTETISITPPNNLYKATVDNGAVLGGSGFDPAYNNGSYGTYDPLSNATKWFYQMYRESKLDDAGYVSGFSYTDNAWADALQLVFWRLEGEIAAADGIPNNDDWKHLNGSALALTSASWTWADIVAKANTLWNFYQSNDDTGKNIDSFATSQVMVLNLWNYDANLGDMTKMDVVSEGAYRYSLRNEKHQSQLYYAEGGGVTGSGPVVPEPTSLVAWLGFGAMGLIAAARRRRSRGSS